MPDEFVLYTPLSTVLPAGIWPEALLESDGGSLLDRIAYEDSELVGSEDGWGATLQLRVMDEVSLPLPILGGMALVLGSGSLYANIAGSGFTWQGEIAGELFKLRFPRWMLKPAMQQDGAWVADPDERHHSEIILPVSFVAESSGEADLIWPGDATVPLNLPKSFIGDTGFMIEATDLVLRLNGATPIPAGYAELGLPESWRGLLIAQASLTLPPEFDITPNQVQIRHCAIGSGGFSGTVATPVNAPEGTLAGMRFQLSEIALSFAQNVPTRTELIGRLFLPFFEEWLDVIVSVGMNGDLLIRLAQEGGIYELQKEDVLKLRLQSISFEKRSDTFLTYVSGLVTPLFGRPALDWPSFQVEQLGIDQDGNVYMNGGWIDLRDQYSFSFYGFLLEITRLGFGKSEDGGKWIGFNGSLKLVDGLTAGGSVEGLRITWYDSGAPKITLNGVGVELSIPDVLSFKGFVSYREEDGHRFDGDVSLSLIALGLDFTSKLVIGFHESGEKYYALHLGAQLPAGIPLGATGLALYGIEGLFANQMAPNKAVDEEWFEGWYKRPDIGVTDLRNKWSFAKDNLAFGAGVTIGTMADNGYIFSGGMLLVLIFPGPIIMIEGKANILSRRANLREDSVFRAIGILDKPGGSLLLGLDAQYKFDSSGALIDLGGSAEAFFNWNTYDWHLYLGRKDPREQRLRAAVFGGLFQADSYFMIDPGAIQMGARAGYYNKWKFGPVRITAEAWVEGDAAVNWQPTHFTGSVGLHGGLSVRVYGFGVGLSVDASLAATVFNPRHIVGKFRVRVKTPWPLPDIKVGVTLEWGPEKNFPALPLPLKEIAVEHLGVSTKWPLPRHPVPRHPLPPYAPMLLPDYDPDNNSFLDALPADPAKVPANLDELPIVPLDCRPHITFSRPVHDDAMVGLNPRAPSPAYERIGNPQTEEGPVEARYGLKEVGLERWEGASQSWLEVARARKDDPAEQRTLYGSWAPIPSLDASGGDTTAQVKLWLWSKTPFNYTQRSGTQLADWFSGAFSSYTCPPIPPDREVCCDFDDHIDELETLGETWTCPETGMLFTWFNVVSRIEYDLASEGAIRYLCLVGPFEGQRLGEVYITLKEPAKRVTLHYHGQKSFIARGYDANGQAFDPLEDSPQGTLEIAGEGIVRVHILLLNVICFGSVCATIGLSVAEIALRLQLQQHTEERLAVWDEADNVLNPYTKYRIKVITTIDAQGRGPLDGQVRQPEQTEYAYFQTGGPPGTTQYSLPIDHQGEFDSGLDDLTNYVRETIPPVELDQSGRPILPRPVYRAYDVSVIFNENYVDQMYRMAGRDLGLYLYDNNNRIARDKQGQIIVAASGWDKADEVSLTSEEQRWLLMLQNSRCLSFDPGDIVRDSKLGQAEGHLLEPDAFYEARLVPLLLHESFGGYAPPAAADGPAGSLGRWRVVDEAGASAGPSHWEVRSEGSPVSFFIAQTSAIGGGSADPASVDQPGALLLYGDPADADQPGEWDNYRISAYARLASQESASGLVLRYQDASHFYLYLIRAGYHWLVRVANGRARLARKAAQGFELNRDYLLSAEAVGPDLRVYLDGALLFAVSDAQLSKGRAGLYCWKNSSARFSDVRIDDLRDNAPVAYRFQFTTSRFANFFDHMHSFPERAFAAPLSSDAPLNSAQGSAVALGRLQNGQSINPDEAKAYDTFAQAVLGPSALQQPPRLEVNRVVRGAAQTTRALLIRSPEPIDWRRTEVVLTYTAQQLDTPLFTGAVKIAEMQYGTGTSRVNDEWLTLLLGEDLDLTGWRVEMHPRGVPAPIWITYHRFEQTTKGRAGTRVRIYSGNQSDAPPEEGSLIQRFVATGSDAGTRVFSLAGMEFRLVKPDDSVVCARTFVTNGSFVVASVKTLRKADGTGFALLASSFPVGSYRLTLTYHRADREPALSESGSTSQEFVTLDIP